MRRILALVLLATLTACGGTAAPTSAPVATPAATSAPTPILATATPAPPTATPIPPSPTPAPPSVAVIAEGTYTDPHGNLSIFGVVANQGTAPVENVKIRAAILDRAGNPIGKGDDHLLALVILPAGAKAPFEILPGTLTGTYASHTLTATASAYDPTAPFSSTAAPGISIEGVNLSKGGASSSDFPKVTGRYKNDGATAVQFPTVLAIGYDAAGKVVAVAKGGTGQTELAPKSADVFEISFYRLDLVVDHVDLLPAGIVKP